VSDVEIKFKKSQFNLKQTFANLCYYIGMKNIIIVIGIIIVIAGAFYFLSTKDEPVVVTPGNPQNTATTTPIVPVVDTTKTVMGYSVENRNILAYHYGTGSKEIVFVGGIHGGYEWNTTLLAYELMDYLTANPDAIPENIRITIIPVLNPDGLYKVTGKEGRFEKTDVSSSRETVIAGRYNANNVDLGRNFDCDWQTKGVWQKTTVSGGTAVFSEPESIAFKNYIETQNPTASVVWYSSAGGVFSSSCGSPVSVKTKALTDLYAKASGYKAYSTFDFYKTSGDLVNWLAKKNIPAISVLLTTHENTEFSKNLAGMKAVLVEYSK